MKRSREEWLTLARRYVHYCARTGTVPRVEEMATMLSMSREGLTRAFHASTGLSPANVFRRMQMRHAQSLLESTEMSVAHIARVTAFGSERAFYRAFLRCTGVTPTTYRRTARQSRRR